jgi:tetratricopeptide (TPR) repeat protein
MTPIDQGNLLRRVRQALQQENFPDAIDALREAIAVAQQTGDQAAQGRHLGNLALIYNRLQQPDEAIRCLEQALALARADKDRLTESGILGNMGNILREMGEYEQALSALSQAVEQAEATGDVRGKGIWYSNIGLTYDDLRYWVEAIRFHKEAVTIARQLNDQRSLNTRLEHLARSYLAAEQATEAIKCLHETVAIRRSLQELAEASYQLGWIGSIYAELGLKSSSDFEADFYYNLAQDTYESALLTARDSGNAVAMAEIHTYLGSLYGNRGQYPAAYDHFRAAYDLFASLNHTDQMTYAAEGMRLAEQYLR